MVQSDKGTEFLNSTFQSMLRRHDIYFYTSENEDLKAAVVERFHRTLKEKMFRYFTHANTRRYVGALDDMLHSYNNTQHNIAAHLCWPREKCDFNRLFVRYTFTAVWRNMCQPETPKLRFFA